MSLIVDGSLIVSLDTSNLSRKNMVPENLLQKNINSQLGKNVFDIIPVFKSAEVQVTLIPSN